MAISTLARLQLTPEQEKIVKKIRGEVGSSTIEQLLMGLSIKGIKKEIFLQNLTTHDYESLPKWVVGDMRDNFAIEMFREMAKMDKTADWWGYVINWHNRAPNETYKLIEGIFGSSIRGLKCLEYAESKCRR